MTILILTVEKPLLKLSVLLMMLLRNFLLKAMRVNPVYVEIPENVDIDTHVVDWTTVHDWIDSQAREPEVYEIVDNRDL